MGHRSFLHLDRWVVTAFVLPIPVALLLPLLGPSLWLLAVVAWVPTSAVVSYGVSCRVSDQSGQPWAYLSFLASLAVWLAGGYVAVIPAIQGS